MNRRSRQSADIISGAAFDYNLPCIAESLIVVASVADRLIQQMQDFDALLLSRQEGRYPRTVCLPDGAAIKVLVGEARFALLAAAGLVPPRPRLLIAMVVDSDPGTCKAADAGAAVDRQGRRL